MTYRADIDGLRALAVLPVLFFHAGFSAFSGGFIGVDVFFVISGYLITGILMADLDRERFSILRFYERRVRRILPALFAVLAFSLAVGWILLLPVAYESLAKSAFSATLFASNIYFWRQVGYFNAASDLFALQHTWSLAVEEQFYIGFPLLLWLMRRARARLIALVVGAISLLSFALSVYAVEHHPSVAFFLIPTRAWELGIGALLAILAPRAPTSRGAREALAALGTALILAPVFAYDRSTAFPGLAALWPCLGTAALIWAGTPCRGAAPFFNRLLSVRPVVFVGLISYSLYLWHWPFLVFARYYLIELHLPTGAALVCLGLSFAAAALSWSYIERPFRQKGRIGPRAIFSAAVAGSAALVTVSATLFLFHGAPGRADPQAIAIAKGTEDFSPLGMACIKVANAHPDQPIRRECYLGAEDSEPAFLLWGDSHAAHMTDGFDATSREVGLAGVVVTDSVCPPLASVTFKMMNPPELRQCARRNEAVLNWAANAPDLKLVALVGYWDAYWRRDDAAAYGGEAAGNVAESRALYAQALEEVILTLREAGKEVAVLHRLPEPEFHVPWALSMARHLDRPPPEPFSPAESEFSAHMQAMFDRHGVISLPMDAPLCEGGACRLIVDLQTTYSDNNHLSRFAVDAFYRDYLVEGLFSNGQ